MIRVRRPWSDPRVFGLEDPELPLELTGSDAKPISPARLLELIDESLAMGGSVEGVDFD